MFSKSFNAIVTPRSEADCNRLASMVHTHGLKTSDEALLYVSADGTAFYEPMTIPFKIDQPAVFNVTPYGKTYSGYAWPSTVDMLEDDVVTVNELSDLLRG